MNVANLQLQGLLAAVASINHALVRKGVLTAGEIGEALRKAEASVAEDGHVANELSPSNQDAVHFPIRLLQLANLHQSNGAARSFSQLAKDVGQTK